MRLDPTDDGARRLFQRGIDGLVCTLNLLRFQGNVDYAFSSGSWRWLSITGFAGWGCGREFTAQEKVPRYGPGCHQVVELPRMAAFYVEHRTHRLCCPGCRVRTRADIGFWGESCFGALLQATVVALSARNRISRRDMAELLLELFAVSVSVGAIDAICQRTSGLLEDRHEHLTRAVLASGALNMDETGWYRNGEGRTMWTITTPQAAVFKVMADRHQERLEELLSDGFSGIVTSDRWWAHDLLDGNQRQACWSHLQRDFRYHSEGFAEQKIFGESGRHEASTPQP